MHPLKKEDLSQEVFNLYDDYAHNRIDRRTFAERLSTYAVGGVTVASLMGFLMPDYKHKVQIAQDDPRVVSEYINYESPKGGGTMKALLAKPAKAKGKTWRCCRCPRKPRPESAHRRRRPARGTRRIYQNRTGRANDTSRIPANPRRRSRPAKQAR